MKIIKYKEFILEQNEEEVQAEQPAEGGEGAESYPQNAGAPGRVVNDVTKNYIDSTLNQLKRKIDKMFDVADGEEDEKMTVQKAKENSKGKSNAPTFKEFNLRLESSEVSKYNGNNRYATFLFSDDEFSYKLTISLNNGDVNTDIKNDTTKDFEYGEISNSFVTFKKYDIDTFEIIGQISKNISPNKIDEEFIINLKILKKMATNPPKGDGHRNGAVRDRSQTYNPKTETWVKRDSDNGRFMDVKKDGTPRSGGSVWYAVHYRECGKPTTGTCWGW